MLRLEDIRKSYDTGSDRLEVLRGVDLTVGEGEIVAIVGPSGVGKSTLLHIMGALDVPTSGKVYVRGTDVFAMSGTERAAFRNRTVGFVFQFHHLLRELTALENVMMPCLVGGMDRDEAASRAEELLAAVRLSDRADHRPGELSGGEEQRAAVARALVTKPLMVLADEPSGNLDRASSDELHDLIWGLRESSGQTFVIVTHNPDLYERADRVVTLREGRATESERGVQR
ncbi:MAG: ABC transporter ATP-binding protein [Candidatus Eisenbacteria sp.]|nr:ABC transporter ATP-binding protein [Candidatus Eisenbacteria bacterium]